MANELRQLIDTANAPIFGIDVKGTVNEWNLRTAEITGYSREEAIGQPLVSKFIVKQLRQSVQRVMDNALQGNETSNYELEFRTKVSIDHNLFWIWQGSVFRQTYCYIIYICKLISISQMKSDTYLSMRQHVVMLTIMLLELWELHR